MLRRGSVRFAALILVLLLAAASAFAESTVEQRLEDLETLRAGLEEGHYDLFALVSPEEWAARVEETAEKLRDGALDERMACYALIELVASVGDAHTQAWFTAEGQLGTHALPLQTGLFDDGLYLLGTTQPYAEYLGMEIVAIEGAPIDEVFRRLTPIVSYDNETRLRTQLAGNVADADAMRYVGVSGSAEGAEVTFRDAEGNEYATYIDALAGEEIYAAQFAFLERERVPAAEQPASIYEFSAYGDALWIGYYSCAEDTEHPMAAFIEEVAAELEAGEYKKVCVDLRYNGGGNSAVLEPMIDRLAALKGEMGFEIYALIGENTFSSAVMNAAQLKTRAGATLVGRPTGGSANHYGELQSFDLEHLPLTVYYSTKYFEMLPGYAPGSLMPDIEVERTLADYLAGRDCEMEAVQALQGGALLDEAEH